MPPTTDTPGTTCCSTCDQPLAGAPVMACTLDAAAFQDRIERIHDLAGRSLRHAERDGRTLHLTYAPDARAEVEALVAAESACCAFLAFDLTHDPDGTRLTIVAPEAAGDAADKLFAHFAPNLTQDPGPGTGARRLAALRRRATRRAPCT